MKSAFGLALQAFEMYLSMDPESEDSRLVHQYMQVLQDYRSCLN